MYNPSSSSPSVPPEIWLQIFRTATFIPGEWSVSATPSHPNEFTSSNGLHIRAYKAVLPLRRTIVQVSRLWWQIGSEVFYASFHESLSRFRHIQALDHFERSLLSRPALGCFIKRLGLWWPRKGSSSQIDHILQLCPNTRILSFYNSNPDLSGPWEPRILVNHIRIFDAAVYILSQKSIVHMLSGLPNVEILHLSGLKREREESRHHGTLRLPLVHFLSLSFYDDQGIEYWTPLLSTADIPRLTSLSMSRGASLPFTIDVWQRITFFTTRLRAYSTLKPEIFRSLTHLQLELDEPPFRHQQGHFPFHQLSHLTIIYRRINPDHAKWWKQTAEVILALNWSEMPLLKVVELQWGYYGIHDFLDRISGDWIFGKESYFGAFLDYLESLAHNFEQVGVQFQEVYTEDMYLVPISIKDVIKIVRDTMAIRLALPKTK